MADRLDEIREHVELYSGAPITDGYGPLVADLRWLLAEVDRLRAELIDETETHRHHLEQHADQVLAATAEITRLRAELDQSRQYRIGGNCG